MAALVHHGFDVLLPFGDGHPYDLAVTIDHSWFVRVQCKTAWASRGCLLFNSRSTDHGRGPQPYVGLADIFGVYFPQNEAIYLVPIDAVADTQGRLRLEPTRNNQRKRVRLAAEYEMERWTPLALRGIVEPSADARIPLAAVA